MAELRQDLIEFYRQEVSQVTFVPLAPENKVPISKLYVKPKVVEIDSNTKSERKSIFVPFIGRLDEFQSTDDKIISTYKEVFLENDVLKRNIYLQGEPGTGKSTFCSRLILDWCNAIPDGPSSDSFYSGFFSDIDILSRFAFLFFISLREATTLCSVEEMITSAIIEILPR